MPREIFPNIGYIKSKLNKEVMDRLNSYIKNKKGSHKSHLAGNINKSYNLKDKDNWFFENVLLKLLYEYEEKELNVIVPSILTNNCRYVLNSLWVNFQKKHEFNPIHSHTGAVFSFVVWMQIPSSYKKEKEIAFMKESNTPSSNTFQFSYTNSLGLISTKTFYLEPEDAGTILFFPATLSHQVYPFYLSNKYRISISGNIALDPKQIM
tara:strand:+ start:4105 stop:4728 length:624 start_codon:yes stop_codon:yes gene_type:complete